MTAIAGAKEDEFNQLLPKVIFEYKSFIPQNDMIRGFVKSMTSTSITFSCLDKDAVKNALYVHNIECKDDQDNGFVTVSFDYCLICVGAKYLSPIRWDSDNSEIYPNQQYSINSRIKEARGKIGTAKTAIIVGGGYVALELAGYLAENNIETTIAIRGKTIMNNKWFTEDMRKKAEEILKQKNIKV